MCYSYRVRSIAFPGKQPLNMILNDGRDLMSLIHKKYPQYLTDICDLSKETLESVSHGGDRPTQIHR